MSSGSFSINMRQMRDKWKPFSDNVKYQEKILENQGKFFTLDTRPYEDWLNEFNIYYTLRRENPMATAKQIAARKLFAARAKAGTLKRKKNPARKAATKKAPAKKRAINRPSQATGKPPTARLKARRRANTVPGAFPNPRNDSRLNYEVVYTAPESHGYVLDAAFVHRHDAQKYAANLAAEVKSSGWKVYIRTR